MKFDMGGKTMLINPLPRDVERADPTAGEFCARVAGELRAGGSEDAALDARVLMAHALGIEAAELLAASDRRVGMRARIWLGEATRRRLGGEPVARIVGYKEFWSRLFALGPDTLVPRPESETLVEAALAAFPDRNAAIRVLDLGTGTGALLAAILLERPRAMGVGVDRSTGALAVACGNFNRLGLARRTMLVCGDWGAALGKRFDLIIANPPYIVNSDIAVLPCDVRDHDPVLALDGGADGLDAYRSILSDLSRVLAREGVAILELGDGQEEPVAALARNARLIVNGAARRDLAGRPRALVLGALRVPKKTLGSD